jgi:CubicO group peptidase (beta-lactamase class C family)
MIGHRITELLRRARKSGLVWCASARWSGSSGGGEVHVGTLGLRRPQTVSSETIYDLASLTKVLAVTPLVTVAVRRGLIRWDTRVQEVLPELPADRPVGRATVAELLQHTAGLRAWHPLYAEPGADPGRIEATIARLELEPLGGARHRYSCLGFIVLGVMLERVMGDPLRHLFTELVARPLGVEASIGFWDSRIWPPDLIASPATSPGAEAALCGSLGLAASWLERSSPAELRPDDGNARFLGGSAGNAGLFGTIGAVAAIAREFIGGGELLTADEAETVASCGGRWTPGDRAYGWSSAGIAGGSSGPWMSSGSIGHTGFTGTSVWVDRERKTILVLLADRVHPGHHGADLQPLRRAFHRIVLTS